MEDTERMTVRKIVMTTPTFASAIKTYRHRHEFNSEADAIRALILLGLQFDLVGDGGQKSDGSG